MGTGKVLAQQAQFAQAVGGHEMGVVNDGHEHLAGAVNDEGVLDEQSFAVMVEVRKNLAGRVRQQKTRMENPSRGPSLPSRFY